MNKISEFYTKALRDESAKEEIIKILGGKSFEEADQVQLLKIGEIAKQFGYDITLEEVREYLEADEKELEEEELDAVAGGKLSGTYGKQFDDCDRTIGGVVFNVNI